MKVVQPFQYADIQGFKFGSTLYGKPKLFSIVYFIDGLLIDTGHINMRKEIVATLKDLPVEQQLITHHHEDHTGNLDVFQEYFQQPSYASAECIEIMKLPPAISPAQHFGWGDRPANFKLKKVSQQIKTTQYCFDIIPIPGHAPDMIALHEPQQGWLFSADLWVYHYIRYFMRPESMKEQIESLKRVAKLEFDVLLCGHNPQFKDVKNKIQQKLQFLEDFYDKAATLHQKGYSEKEIFTKMQLKESWQIRIFSLGALSTINMVRAVLRDEQGTVQ